MTRHTTAQLRAMADELEALWREESLRDDNPAKGRWSPDGLRALASLRDELAAKK